MHAVEGAVRVHISIHAPRMGSDATKLLNGELMDLFQSTLPGWGATRGDLGEDQAHVLISIHAPRMGSDLYLLR